MLVSKINVLKILTAVFAMLVFPALAQGPGDGGPTPTEPPTTEIPIDGGASLLIAGGAALGLNKLRNKYKK
jgi:hypothetical protein